MPDKKETSVEGIPFNATATTDKRLAQKVNGPNAGYFSNRVADHLRSGDTYSKALDYAVEDFHSASRSGQFIRY